METTAHRLQPLQDMIRWVAVFDAVRPARQDADHREIEVAVMEAMTSKLPTNMRRGENRGG